MWFSRFAALGLKVETFDNTLDIHKKLTYLDHYRADPWKGKLDNLSHPTLVQKRIYNGMSLGDCDDHGIYWATALLKSDLAVKVWFCSVQYKAAGDTERIGGHIRCVWEDHAGRFWWADYDAPRQIEDFATGWVQSYLDAGATVIGTIMIPVVRVTKKDTPKFGKVSDIITKIKY